MSMTVDDILNSHRTGTPVVMGILNITPDSFSDGGRYLDPAAALARARAMVDAGADMLDVGAESTRPGSERVSAAEQIDRLEPVLADLCSLGVPVSVDTTSAEAGAFALDAGAAVLNDVSAGRDDPAMFALAAETGAPLIFMHMLGEPKSMQAAPIYGDVAAEVRDFLAERLAAAAAVGVSPERCILDPGVGFGKTLEHNLSLLASTALLAELGRPVLIGASRKRFIAGVCHGAAPGERLGGSLAAAAATWRDGATIFRVHDVAPTRQMLDVLRRIDLAGRERSPRA